MYTAKEFNRFFSEYLPLSEPILFEVNKKFIDTFLISDNIKTEQHKYYNLNDILSLIENLNVVSNFTIIKNENITFNDNILTIKEYERFFNEFLTIRENIKPEVQKRLHDMMVISETVKKSYLLNKNESFIISEETTNGSSKQLNDSFNVNENLTKHFQVRIIDDISIIEEFTKISEFNLSKTELLELEAAISFLQSEPFTSKKTVLITSKNKTILITK
jgi:hypothetical protein